MVTKLRSRIWLKSKSPCRRSPPCTGWSHVWTVSVMNEASLYVVCRGLSLLTRQVSGSPAPVKGFSVKRWADSRQQSDACWPSSCNRELSCTRHHPAACQCCTDPDNLVFLFLSAVNSYHPEKHRNKLYTFLWSGFPSILSHICCAHLASGLQWLLKVHRHNTEWIRITPIWVFGSWYWH